MAAIQIQGESALAGVSQAALLTSFMCDGRIRTLGGDEIEVSARREVTTHVNIVVPSMRPPAYAVACGVAGITGSVLIAGGMFLLHRSDSHNYFTR